jgi:hypothetical protein
MSIWDKYPDLTTSELQVLVALTAQALRENAVDPSTGSESRLDLSPAAAARELAPALQAVDPAITRQQIQDVLEDETLSAQLCYRILDGVKAQPVLADRIAQAYEERRQKMTGVELVLLAGALVILAIKVRKVQVGPVTIALDPAGDAVKAFAAGLVKGVAGG